MKKVSRTAEEIDVFLATIPTVELRKRKQHKRGRPT
jgi:hypothetical protein